MGFLKKVLSVIPGLGGSGDLGADDGIPRREELPRAPRVRILELLNIRFRMTEPSQADDIRVGNLSTTGAGFIRSSFANWPDSSVPIRGEFDFDGRKYPAVVRIIHLSPALVGCSFDGEFAELRAMVQRYFEVELSAIAMSQTAPDLLQADPDGEPHWFHGKSNCELYFISNESKVVRFNLSFFGNYLEGGEGEPTRFGQVVEDNYLEKPKYKGSSLIHWEPTMPRELTETALRFINNIRQLDPAHRDAIVERIRTTKH